MKNCMKKGFITMVCVLACSCAALANSTAFTPLNFENSFAPIKTSDATSTSAISKTATSSEEPAGNAKMQNAIVQLDNAQVDVRNELLNYKTKFSGVDAQYNAIKAERKALEKQIKFLEKRIQKIDKQKENIRKNML